MFWADFRLKLGQFFRRYSRIIILGLLVWAAVLVINSLLSGYEPPKEMEVTYNPHESILNSEQSVPKNLQQPIDELIDRYFRYCQNKEYELAYNMILDDCKSIYFRTIQDFIDYVDFVFDGEKTYYIQNYSNYKSHYVYQVRIFEDIMKTGLTGKKELSFYEEKISVREVDGELKLGIRQYIASEDMDQIYEDNYLKIWIEKRNMFYEQEGYVIKIKNKSEFVAVLADGTESYEAILVVGSTNRYSSNNNLNIVIQPGDTIETTINFSKFYDETYLSKGIIFNNVRILKTYSGSQLTRDYEMQEAEKLYGIQIPF